MKSRLSMVALQPRSVSGCLDLAFRCCGQNLSVMVTLWLVIAVPLCSTVYLLTDMLQLDLRLAIAMTYFATVPLGALLVQGVAPGIFGQELSIKRIANSAVAQLVRAIVVATANRCLIAIGPILFLMYLNWGSFALAAVLFVFPGCWLAIRDGFRFEKVCLPRMDRRFHGRGNRELINESFRMLLENSFRIHAFCVLLWLVLIATVEAALYVVFGISLIWVPMQELWSMALPSSATQPIPTARFRYILEYVAHAPAVCALLAGVMLAVYQVGRLAWFFCYIDARVRQDCWDIELRFLEQTQRLESAG